MSDMSEITLTVSDVQSVLEALDVTKATWSDEILAKLLKVGVHLKAIFTPLKIGQMKISCLHFKQDKNPPFIAQINDLGCFMKFWVIFRYIWKEIIFLEGLVKLKEIRNVEDLVKF